MRAELGLLCLLSSAWGCLVPLVGALLHLECVSVPVMVVMPLWGILPVICGCADHVWALVTGCGCECQSGGA